MQLMEKTAVVEKTRELCQSILDDPQYQSMKRHIDVFMNDDDAKTQYQLVLDKNDHLTHKQSQGLQLTDQEVDEFEALRAKLFNNPVAKSFMEAQGLMQEIHQSVQKYISKTFELGRVPEAEDLESGGCGCDTGCGCH